MSSHRGDGSLPMVHPQTATTQGTVTTGKKGLVRASSAEPSVDLGSRQSTSQLKSSFISSTTTSAPTTLASKGESSSGPCASLFSGMSELKPVKPEDPSGINKRVPDTPPGSPDVSTGSPGRHKVNKELVGAC